MKVMFVCLGNICRSPAAQSVFEMRVAQRGLSALIEAESSGTSSYHVGDLSDSRMRKAAKSYAVDIYHHSRHFTIHDLQEYDLILAMDSNNLSDILRMAKDESERRRVKMFREFDPEGPGDVPDPYYGGAQGFDNVMMMLLRTCDIIIDRIEKDTI